MQAFSEILSAPSESPSSKASFSRLIKERAQAEGFDQVGIVGAAPLDSEADRLNEWLARGYHAEMQWMARDSQKRTNPLKIFPLARSVVVVALNYYTPHKHQDNPTTGKVSRYAWGDDYHEVINRKLRALLSWIKEQRPEAEGKVCVDIQPVMDKAWAVRAGLGWLGKHTNMITTRYGSWVFIGELLLNLDLEYNTEEVEDHCGSCSLCIDSCPTQAITEPYVVDSNRCISYGTIELRAENLPEPITKNLSGWFYGCDICQDVCPWNRFEQVTQEEDSFSPREGNINAKLTDIVDLSPEAYAERFRHSPMKRAKLSGLKRNARALLDDRQT